MSTQSPRRPLAQNHLRHPVTVTRRTFVGASVAAFLGLRAARSWASANPATEDLLFSSAVSISKAIRSGQVSSLDMVKACIARIEEVNPRINAVVTLAADQALHEAKKADAELARGHCRGLLHGVPMTIKDSFDTAGVLSTAGTEGRKTFVPKHDATVVARLRAAGAILLGKSNTPELTMSYDTRNLLFGFTKNPYDLSKSPGGSSGGAAAIVAAGGVPFDMGSDTGGSIRVPSCFCGAAGIKPTTGRMALTGHIIRTGQGIGDPLTQVGPIARYVDDLFPLLRETAGPDGRDPAVVPMPLRNPGDVRIGDLRVAFHTDNGIKAASEDVATTVKKAAGALKDVAASVHESCPRALASLMEFWLLPDLVDGCEWMKQILREAGTTRWDPHIDWIAEFGTLSGVEFTRMYRQWHKYRADMIKYMNRYDVIVCPVNAQASWPSGFDISFENLRSFSYTGAYNITGWPAAVVRCGTSNDGMPIGVQVVARPWREDLCLAVAKFLETTFGGWRRPVI